jgi:hypothetical protein
MLGGGELTRGHRVQFGLAARVAVLCIEDRTLPPTLRAKIAEAEAEIAKIQALIERVRQYGGSHPDYG